MNRFTSPQPVARAAWTESLGQLAPLDAAAVLGEPQAYWARASEDVALAGFGIAQTVGLETRDGVNLLESLAADVALRQAAAPATRLPPLLWLGGLGFHPGAAHDARWSAFGAARFQLPRLMVWRQAGESFVTAFEETTEAARSRCQDTARALAGPTPSLDPRVASAVRPPADPGAWRVLHARALEAIQQGRLRKVVLARPIDVEGSVGGLRAVLGRLAIDGQQGTLFAFEGGRDAWFVGLTPELLVRIRGELVETEALAGTAKVGEGQGLLGNERIQREHGAVVDAIREALAPLCHALELAPTPVLRRLRDVEHLHLPVCGRSLPGVGLDAIVRALHPTPATGGTPRDEALQFLAANEGFERGWYAGALGGVGPEGLHLSVGLRSALIHPGGARLFVGAGVVAGSTADAEWEETEAKARPMLRAVGIVDG